MATGDTPYLTAQRLSRAYVQLRSNRALQFDFSAPKPATVPNWLGWLVKIFGTVQPVLSDIAIGAVVLLVIGLVFVLIRGAHRGRRRPKPALLTMGPEGGVDWRPDATKALILLQDADRLAAESRFTEAAHLLLLRSVQDIQSRHPGLVRPAQTSRDIARLDALSSVTRDAFTAMADLVEHSLFGGRPVGAEAFAACRRTYEGFAFPAAWSGGARVGAEGLS